MTIILHMTPRSRWEAALENGQLTADSLEREGFIHCSFPDQLERVANKHYRGLTDLVLLCIEAEQVGSEVRYEVQKSAMKGRLTPTPGNRNPNANSTVMSTGQ